MRNQKSFEAAPSVHGLDVDKNRRIHEVIGDLKKYYAVEHAEGKIDGSEFDLAVLRGFNYETLVIASDRRIE